MLATNIITKPMPTMMIPELKLLAATMTARGTVIRTALATPAIRSTSLPILVIRAAMATMTVIFTNSVG